MTPAVRIDHFTEARRRFRVVEFSRGSARQNRAAQAIRSACIFLAWKGWRFAAAVARGPRWIVTADRVVELAVWDVAGRCWRTETAELHPAVALYQTPEAAISMSRRTSCFAPSAGDTSPAAAPTWLTRQWTWSPGLASIALRLGAGRCCTELRSDGSLVHHRCWHGISPTCLAPGDAC